MPRGASGRSTPCPSAMGGGSAATPISAGLPPGFRAGLPERGVGASAATGLRRCGRGHGARAARPDRGRTVSCCTIPMPDARRRCVSNWVRPMAQGRVSICADPVTAAAGADGIVNATPMGMAKFPGTADARQLRSKRGTGWRISSISRSKPNCSQQPRRTGCAPSMAAAWRCTRRRMRSRYSPGARPTARGWRRVSRPSPQPPAIAAE